jgi:hypothetical protein
LRHNLRPIGASRGRSHRPGSRSGPAPEAEQQRKCFKNADNIESEG